MTQEATKSYTDIRVHHQSDQSGTCELTDKRKAFVFPVEMPIGSRPLRICDTAFQQEIRKILLLNRQPTPDSAESRAAKSKSPNSSTSAQE